MVVHAAPSDARIGVVRGDREVAEQQRSRLVYLWHAIRGLGKVQAATFREDHTSGTAAKAEKAADACELPRLRTHNYEPLERAGGHHAAEQVRL
jgi:hypothetical protein